MYSIIDMFISITSMPTSIIFIINIFWINMLLMPINVYTFLTKLNIEKYIFWNIIEFHGMILLECIMEYRLLLILSNKLLWNHFFFLPILDNGSNGSTGGVHFCFFHPLGNLLSIALKSLFCTILFLVLSNIYTFCPWPYESFVLEYNDPSISSTSYTNTMNVY